VLLDEGFYVFTAPAHRAAEAHGWQEGTLSQEEGLFFANTEDTGYFSGP
jgi:hypothetical protein